VLIAAQLDGSVRSHRSTPSSPSRSLGARPLFNAAGSFLRSGAFGVPHDNVRDVGNGLQIDAAIFGALPGPRSRTCHSIPSLLARARCLLRTSAVKEVHEASLLSQRGGRVQVLQLVNHNNSQGIISQGELSVESERHRDRVADRQAPLGAARERSRR
jgi:hypothetical protein